MPYRPKTAFFIKFHKKSSRRRNRLAEFVGIIREISDVLMPLITKVSAVLMADTFNIPTVLQIFSQIQSYFTNNQYILYP